MRDVFEQDSERPHAQLLGSEPASPAREASDPGEQAFDVGREFQLGAEGMIHFLVMQSTLPALLIDQQWTPLDEPFEFPNEANFRAVAQANACVVHKTSRPEEGGTVHLLFMGRNASVTEEQYLACVPPRVPTT